MAQQDKPQETDEINEKKQPTDDYLLICPLCGNTDKRMIDAIQNSRRFFCNVCAHTWVVQ